MSLLFGTGTTRPVFASDMYYGIEWDVAVSNPVCTRIGNLALHKSLPLQTKMRRCLLLDNGTVNYYLHPNNSALKDTGAAAVLDGTDGQVMVEMPNMYVRFEMEGNKRRCLMSEYALPGFINWGLDYVSAYEATLDRTNNKLASVVNTATQYRGGANVSAWDGTYKSLLGKPATAVAQSTFRACARARGSVSWNMLTYQMHRKIVWLYSVEYASFNSQAAFNASLTGEGYRQGGLGAGVSGFDWDKLAAFNNQDSFIPCGITNILGNASGVVAFTMPAEYDITILTTYANSYRGISIPFGHLYKLIDGAKCLIQSDSSGGVSQFYICNNPADFASTGIINYQFRSELPRSNGYIKDIAFGDKGDIIPTSTAGSSSTYYCDVCGSSAPATGIAEKAIRVGGGAANGTTEQGMTSFNATALITAPNNYAGTRLCYLP